MYNPLCCVNDPAVPAGEKSSSSSVSLHTTTTLIDLLNNRSSPSHSPSYFRCQSSLSEHSNSIRSHSVTTSPSNRKNHGRRMIRSLTSPADSQSQVQSSTFQRDAITINDVVGNGVCGILYKWVNYGRGWRARWFVLHDGVLSFYKIHGRDKVIVYHEAAERGGKVIGEDSFRRVSSRRGSSIPSESRPAKPAGEIHLKIATIQESRSDEKKFSIFTGTKRVRLRAETREERATWMDALLAVKDMYPRISKSESLKVPLGDVTIFTEKLRQRLLQEGLSEVAIQDTEQIMINEFSKLHNQILALKQKEMLLCDTLRHLETEKVDLEETVVDESQRLRNRQEASSISLQDNHEEGSSSDPDYNVDEHEAVEEETEDEDNGYFDTRDGLSCCSFKTSASEFRKSSFDSDDQADLDIDGAVELHMKMMRHKYPYVKRRKKLPDPAEKEKGVNLWSMIKDNIGKDLTKVCLPVYFNEPLSSLQKCFEDMEYSHLIDQAYEWGKMGNSLMRLLNVAAYAISGYACTEGRTCKPFNPLLGETYEADFPDKGLRFISEKVSHHPMILACHCEGRGWKFWGDSNLKSKFWGRSIQLDPIGVLTLEFDDGEIFQWSKVTTSIYNLIIGKLYCDHYGTMHIQGCGEYSCKIKFKEHSIIDRNPHQVQGVVQDKRGKTVATLFGKWDESLYYINGDRSGKGKGSDPLSEASLLWTRSEATEYQTRYNFTKFAMTLNELTPGLKEKLPPTDSRLRPDQRHLENGEFEKANSEKQRLEHRQRQAGRIQEKGWRPMWFEKDRDSGVYRYTGGYWEAREQGKWESCPRIFGDAQWIPDV